MNIDLTNFRTGDMFNNVFLQCREIKRPTGNGVWLARSNHAYDLRVWPVALLAPDQTRQ